MLSPQTHKVQEGSMDSNSGTLDQFLLQNRRKITPKPNAKKPSSPKVLGEQYQPFAYLQKMNPKYARSGW